MVLADSQGMTYDFFSYTGKINLMNSPLVPDLKDSSYAVIQLMQTIPSRKNHLLFFDNWFTSLPLMRHLATRQIWCCGTVRTPRLTGLKLTKASEKDLMKK